MSNVTLHIGGRRFTVACADGEEDHIGRLGRVIDGKLENLGDVAAQSEARMLLFAALLLADEIHELRAQLAGGADGAGGDTGARLEQIAMQLEKLASQLEG